MRTPRGDNANPERALLRSHAHQRAQVCEGHARFSFIDANALVARMTSGTHMSQPKASAAPRGPLIIPLNSLCIHCHEPLCASPELLPLLVCLLLSSYHCYYNDS